MAAIGNPLEEILGAYLQRRCGDGMARLAPALTEFERQPARAAFFRLFALAPRWFGREPAMLTPSERAQFGAQPGRPGLGPWSDQQFARLMMLLRAQTLWQPAQFQAELDTLFNTADTGELVALYRALPMLRQPQDYCARAREGARSNMLPVFLAIAHYNTFPADYFDQEGWNQLVLKAIFNACPLDPVFGLDQRANPTLAHMLADYARERRAAGRDVPWDIWRCMGSHLQERDMDLLAEALTAGADRSRQAAALALRDCGTDRALAILARHPGLKATTEGLTWSALAGARQSDDDRRG